MSKNTRRGRPRRVLQKEGSPLFAGVMAWFSSSVSQDKKVAWSKYTINDELKCLSFYTKCDHYNGCNGTVL